MTVSMSYTEIEDEQTDDQTTELLWVDDYSNWAVVQDEGEELPKLINRDDSLNTPKYITDFKILAINGVEADETDTGYDTWVENQIVHGNQECYGGEYEPIPHIIHMDDVDMDTISVKLYFR